MQLYAITDRKLYPGDEASRLAALLHQVEQWVRAGVQWIQIREKDLPPEQLETLTRSIVTVANTLRIVPQPDLGPGAWACTLPRVPIILVNGDAELARRAGADGVHLPGVSAGSGEDGSSGGGGCSFAARVAEVQAAWAPGIPAVSTACHTLAEVDQASAAGAWVIVYAPVFEKPLWNDPGTVGAAKTSPSAYLPGTGLSALSRACAAAGKTPVFALGGISAANAKSCILAGAAGVAGIRLFAGESWRSLLEQPDAAGIEPPDAGGLEPPGAAGL